MKEIFLISFILLLIFLLTSSSPIGQFLLYEFIRAASMGDLQRIFEAASCIIIVISLGVYCALIGRKLARNNGLSVTFWTVLCFFSTVWGCLLLYFVTTRKQGYKHKQ